MTVGDYLDHLFKLGTGWLGWTEAETLDTSMVAIAIAYDARIDMLQAIFGGADKPADKPDANPEIVVGDETLPIADRLKTAFRAMAAKQ